MKQRGDGSVWGLVDFVTGLATSVAIGISRSSSKCFSILTVSIPLVSDLNTLPRKTEVYLRT